MQVKLISNYFCKVLREVNSSRYLIGRRITRFLKATLLIEISWKSSKWNQVRNASVDTVWKITDLKTADFRAIHAKLLVLIHFKLVFLSLPRKNQNTSSFFIFQRGIQGNIGITCAKSVVVLFNFSLLNFRLALSDACSGPCQTSLVRLFFENS